MNRRTRIALLACISLSCREASRPAAPVAPEPDAPEADLRMDRGSLDSLQGLIETALGDSIRVRITDPSGSPVPGIGVTWSGSGSADPPLARTDPSGIASTQWTLGPNPGTARLTASISGGPQLDFTALASPPARHPLQTSPLAILGEGPTDPAVHLRSVGQVRAMLLFIDFADSASQRDPQALSEFLLPIAPWLRQASHERLQLEVVPVLKRYVVGSSYLDHPTAPNGYIDPGPLLREAIEAADPEVDFRGTDIVFVSAPHRLSWAYLSTGAGIVADGQAIRFGIVLGETWLSPTIALAYFLHETGHFFGLPDLYPVGHNPPEFPHTYYGHFDPMAMVARYTDFNSWHKLKLGWIDDSRIKSFEWGSIEVTLVPVGTTTGLLAVVVPTTEVTAYFVEVRKARGLDALMCRDGVLISMVDTTIPSGWGPIRSRRSQLGIEPLPGCNDAGYAAPFDLHSGGPSQYFDSSTGLRVQLLAREADGSYRLRVSRGGEP